MFEQSVLSIWSSMNSWLTPTVLFLLLNLMIGTIVFASTLGSQKHQTQQDQQQHHQGLVRSNSVLQRFKSINFYSYKSEDRHEAAEETKLVRSPSILQRLQSVKFHFHFPQPDQYPQTEIGHNNPPESTDPVEPDQFDSQDHHQQTLDEVYSQLQERHVSWTTSDTKPASGEVVKKPASGEVVKKLPRKMKKSASAKSAFDHFEAEEVTAVERRRPATVREAEQHRHEEDEEVDAKADDFINRFKQHLKLQRIDSIVRYKEMITNRGNDNK